jgi:NAD dependent epimerase/dehydratase family enzyme
MIFGEMGDALLLDSTKVIPKRLTDAGFEFKYPELKGALEYAVK